MGPLLKLFCRGSHEYGAPGPKPTNIVSATASEETIYTHLTTLFEDNEGLYSFVTKFQHYDRYPQDSIRKYLVPASNVVSYKRVELLYRSLPPKHRTSLVQRIHLYDDRKPLFAHLTTVFREERALFSFYLEFQGRTKGSPREIEDRHPWLDQIIYAKEMDPVVSHLAGHYVLSRTSSVQYRSRSHRMIANDGDPDAKTSGPLRERVLTARQSEPIRQWYTEAARPTQRPSLDRSMSTAAARVALYGSDRSKWATRSSRIDQRPDESVSYLDGTVRAREGYHSEKTTQHIESPNRDLVHASTEAHLDQETRLRGSLDRRNRITRLKRHSSTDLRREYIEHHAPERTSRHVDPEPKESTHNHITHTTIEKTRSRSKPRRSQKPSQVQEQRHGQRSIIAPASNEQPRCREDTATPRPTVGADTNTLGGRPPIIDDPPPYIMSPTTELLHNPFAESPPRRSRPRTPPAAPDRIERHHDSMQRRTLRRRSSASSVDSYERPRPRHVLPETSILERSPRTEPRERGSHHVHFDLSDHGTKELDKAYDNTPSNPTYRSPLRERWSDSPNRRTYPPQALSQPSRPPAAPATFNPCKRCKTIPPGIDMQGYCSQCWVHVDPAEKLLCGKCYRTFTAPHEDSSEVLTMCEACYKAVPGVMRERERMRDLGIGFDEGF